MNIYRTQEGGGNFVAPLAVNARMTFIPVKPAGAKAARKLALDGSFTFPAGSPIPWSLRSDASEKRTGSVLVDTDGDLIPDALLPATSNFLPGSSPDRLRLNKAYGECPDPCAAPTCHIDPSTGKEHCTTPAPTGPPYCLPAPCEY